MIKAASPMSTSSNKAIRLGHLYVGEGYPPLVVAELSGNHGGNLEAARSLIDLAARAGARAIKLQTYTADSMTLALNEGDFRISDPKSLWYNRGLHELYQSAATPYEWHEPLFNYAKEKGLLAFSSPFDEQAVDFLETLDVPCYKIASFELTHLPLIRYVAKTGKPLVLSTGMATYEEIGEAVEAARNAGATNLILLKCSSRYPAELRAAHLGELEILTRSFDCPVGYSDHTIGSQASILACALGASLIEKHLAHKDGRIEIDGAFSADFNELKAIVEGVYQAWEARSGTNSVREDWSERQYRRSIYVAEDVQSGDSFSRSNVRIVRPGKGLHPRYWERVLNSRASCFIAKGTALTLEHLSEGEPSD